MKNSQYLPPAWPEKQIETALLKALFIKLKRYRRYENDNVKRKDK